MDNNYFDNQSELMKTLNALAAYCRETLENYNKKNFSKVLQEVARATQSGLPDSSVVSATLSKVAAEQAELYHSIGLSKKIAQELSIVKWDIFTKIANAYQTPEIDKLKKDLISEDYTGLETFVKSINSTHVEAANIALLKISDAFNALHSELPKGIPTILKSLNIGTAERLSTSDSISLDVKSKHFYIEDEPNQKATIEETNIICSSLQVLSGLNEQDLISFLNHLYKFPNLATEHATGKQIMEIISEWKDFTDFDFEYYYHARALPEGACPYTSIDLLKAPDGITWQGRFNFPGESHYYFSNMPKGAQIEVTKHSKESRIQIAKIKPKKRIKMIDLSQKVKSRNKFLDYCRFSPDLKQNIKIRREYLIPCFVANCCKFFGIEGIKYYGSQIYTNYVSWDDTYFDFIKSEIRNKTSELVN